MLATNLEFSETLVYLECLRFFCLIVQYGQFLCFWTVDCQLPIITIEHRKDILFDGTCFSRNRVLPATQLYVKPFDDLDLLL